MGSCPKHHTEENNFLKAAWPQPPLLSVGLLDTHSQQKSKSRDSPEGVFPRSTSHGIQPLEQNSPVV